MAISPFKIMYLHESTCSNNSAQLYTALNDVYMIVFYAGLLHEK